jgi:hypothetical protein
LNWNVDLLLQVVVTFTLQPLFTLMTGVSTVDDVALEDVVALAEAEVTLLSSSHASAIAGVNASRRAPKTQLRLVTDIR